jgi:ATP-dependent helicase HepA
MQRDGLLHYAVHGTIVCARPRLDDLQNVSKAEDRLGQGRVDRNDQFEFRHQALIQRAQSAAQRRVRTAERARRLDPAPAARRPDRRRSASATGAAG